MTSKDEMSEWHVISDPLSKEDYLEHIRNNAIDLQQVIRLGGVMLLRPDEFGDQVREAVLALPDISCEQMAQLVSPPWSISPERIKAHPLYPLYLMEGKDPLESFEKLVDLGAILANEYRKTLASISPHKVADVFGQPPEEQTEPSGDPVGSLAPLGGELVGVDQVGRDADDEADGHDEDGGHKHPGHPGVGFDGADDQRR